MYSEEKKRGFSKNGNGSGGLSFSQFVVLVFTINCEKDSPLGQAVFPPELFPFLENPRFSLTLYKFSDVHLYTSSKRQTIQYK